MMPTCDRCGKKYRIVKQKVDGLIELVHRCKRNPFLTPAMAKIIKMILKSEDQELANFKPGGWWVESQRVHSTACFNLLRLCLIKPVWENAGDKYYQLTPEASKILSDNKYVPLIIQELRKMNK